METIICPECGDSVEKRKAGPHKSVHVRQAKAKYKYFNGDTKHPYEFKACKTCKKELWIQKRRDFCSYSCSKMGDLNPSKQKSSNHGLSSTQYIRYHTIVNNKRGKANSCINGCTGRKMYHWANISGHYEDIDDYQSMCVPCHDKFDREKNKINV